MNQFLHHLTSIFGTDVQVKACASAACLILLTLFGENWHVYVGLVVLVGLDTITGMFAAAKEKEVSSRGFFKGWSKIMVFICLVIAFHQFTRIEPQLKMFDGLIALWIAWNEVISIVENADRMGIPLPSQLTRWLREGRDNLKVKK